MRAYIIRRVLLMIPTLFVVTVMVFLLIRFLPGDVVDAMTMSVVAYAEGTHGGVGASGAAGIEEMRLSIMRRLGLDVPIIQQYGRWLGVWPQADGSFSGVFQGNLGESFLRATTVVEEIAWRWPVTLQLGSMAIIVSVLISLPIGIYSALRQDTAGDYTARSFAIFFLAVPGFWIATLVIVYPAIWWGYFPPIMYVPFFEDPLRSLIRFIVPATILGLAMGGGTMRMTRTVMLEVLRQDYIRTAWAKGLKERVVIIRHALKNALIPIVTIIGLQISILIGGTIIMEVIFVMPGMGSLIVDAIRMRDYPVVSGVMLFFGVAIVLINLMVDLTYGFLDPRIRYR